MFGKLSPFLTYLKVFDVYIVKRFPSNKLPIIGMIFTYFAFYQFLKTYTRASVLTIAYRKEINNKNQERLGRWNF